MGQVARQSLGHVSDRTREGNFRGLPAKSARGLSLLMHCSILPNDAYTSGRKNKKFSFRCKTNRGNHNHTDNSNCIRADSCIKMFMLEIWIYFVRFSSYEARSQDETRMIGVCQRPTDVNHRRVASKGCSEWVCAWGLNSYSTIF